MLRTPLLHPPLLAALAAAGHGSTVLVADANYAISTGCRPGATRVHLNLTAGLLTVPQVVETLLATVPVEAATLLAPDDGSASPTAAAYGDLLGTGVPLGELPREAFVAACRGPALAVVVATGDTRHYANLLLTIGALPPG